MVLCLDLLAFEEDVFFVLDALVVLDLVLLLLVVVIAGLNASNATRTTTSCG